MSAPPDCPGSEAWQALLAGEIAPDEAERCERHLRACPACRDGLDRAEADADHLRRLARQVGDPTVMPADPTLRLVLERLHDSQGPEPAAPHEPLDLFFLVPADRPDLLGRLGPYEVQAVIGQGGMGVVLKAFEPALHRLVAIKVLSPVLAGSATARQRFTREARAAAAVSHDHIVAVYGVSEVNGLPYLVMQYVAGESLQDRLDRAGPLDVTEVVRLGLQTAQALAAAHAQGLIHRDIKPANILLEGEPDAPASTARVKITDFGLARMADDVALTQAGVVAGTPEYMAPEQARGEAVDHRADLFSLGSVLYAMCTGRPPFRGSTAYSVLRQVVDDVPRPLRALNSDMPEWLETLVARLMANDPAERFPSAAEVAGLLEGYLAHRQQPTTVAAPPVPPPPTDVRAGKPEDPEAGSPPAAEGRQGGRRLRLLVASVGFLGSLVLAALWLVLLVRALLPATDVPGRPVRAGRHPVPGLHTLIDQDFRGAGDLPPGFILYGEEGAAIRRDDEGLRVTLPAPRKGRDVAGVTLPMRVAGDFEITTGYELLEANRPTAGHGVGFELSLTIDTPRRQSLGFSRLTRVKEGDVYWSARVTTDENDKQQYQHKSSSTNARSGRMRLVRSGEVVTYWAADGASGVFQRLFDQHLGTEDVTSIRLAASPGWAANPVDIRIKGLRVRARGAGEVGAGAGGQDGSGDGESGGLPMPLIGLAVLGFLVVGIGLAVRHGRRRRKELAPHLADDEPVGRAAGAAAAWPAWLAVWLALAGLGLVTLGLTGNGDATANGAVPAARLLRGHTGPVHDVRFTPDGRLVSGSGWPAGDQTVRLWDPAAGQELGCIPTPAQIHALDLTPDGRFALAGLGNGGILYIDLQTRQVVRTLRGHGGSVGWVTFAADGRHAFSASGDGTARQWELAGGKELARFRVHDRRARGGAVFPDGRRLLTGDSGGLLQVWDLAARQEVKRIKPEPGGFIDSVSLTPDGGQALVAGQGGVRLVDLASGRVVRQFCEEGEEVHHAALSPDGRWLLTGSFDGQVRLWDFRAGELVRVLGSHNRFVFSVAFAPDCKAAASAGGGEHQDGRFVAGTDHAIRLWDLSGLTAGEAAPTGAGVRWWLVAAGLLVLGTGLALAGVWWQRRRRRAAAPVPESSGHGRAGSAPAAATLAVACPGCRRTLRARANLAGKRVKCPRCGRAVAVPAIKPAGSGRIP